MPGEARRRVAPPQGRAGFSLLEAVVALAIVGMVVGGVTATVAAGLRAGDAAREAATAAALADDLLARAALLPTAALEEIETRGGRLTPPHRAYRWSAESRRVAGEEELVELTVTIAGPRGQTRVTTRLHRPRSEGPG